MIITGYYGSGNTETKIFVCRGWYVCEGGTIINFTNDELTDDVHTDYVQDVDCFTFTDGINSMEELEKHVEEHEEYLNENH